MGAVLAWLANSRIGRAVALIFAVVGVAWSIYRRGRSDEENARERERLDAYVETRKRIDVVNGGGGADDARQWLRNRATRRRSDGNL